MKIENTSVYKELTTFKIRTHITINILVINKNHFHILKQKYKGSDFLYYIQETDKSPNFIYRKLNIVKLENNKILLPINEEKISDKQAEKLGKKTKKILEKTNCKKVILSKKIQKQEQYLNELYSYNLEIVEGKWLYEVLLYKILCVVIKNQNMKKEEMRNNNISK